MQVCKNQSLQWLLGLGGVSCTLPHGGEWVSGGDDPAFGPHLLCPWWEEAAPRIAPGGQTHPELFGFEGMPSGQEVFLFELTASPLI